MARRGFRPTKHGLELHLEEFEFQVLSDLFEQLGDLVRPDAQPESSDPLAAMVGIAASADAPSDPALARLLPDAYLDDPAAALDFRRFTEHGLRQQKAESAQIAGASLSRAQSGAVRVTEPEVQAWLRSLNDLRLVLAVRLGIDEAEQIDELPGTELYDWLTWLQSSLVDGVMG